MSEFQESTESKARQAVRDRIAPCVTSFPDAAKDDRARLAYLWRAQQRLMDQWNSMCPPGGPDLYRGFWLDWKRRMEKVGRTLLPLRDKLFPCDGGDEKDELAFAAKMEGRQDKVWDDHISKSDFIIARLQTAQLVDPYQDFTPPTYTEVDPNNHITMPPASADQYTIEFVSRQDESAYVYKDFGPGFFSDFTHEYAATTGSGYNFGTVWGLCNPPVSAPYKNADSVCHWVRYSWPNHWTHELRRFQGVAYKARDYTGETSKATLYYRAVRSVTSVYLYIYTDASRTALWDTLLITDLGGSRQYFVPAASVNYGYAGSLNLTTKNHDLGLSGACPQDVIVSHKADLYTTLTANHNVVDATGNIPLNRNQAYGLMAEIAGVDAGTGRLEFNELVSEKGCKLTVLVYRRVRV